VINADFLDSSYKIPGGGLLSSADDMARFEVAILDDQLLHRATRDAMWTPQKDAEGKQNGYALGWGNGNQDGVATIGHAGSQQGTSTAMAMAPGRRRDHWPCRLPARDEYSDGNGARAARWGYCAREPRRRGCIGARKRIVEDRYRRPASRTKKISYQFATLLKKG